MLSILLLLACGTEDSRPPTGDDTGGPAGLDTGPCDLDTDGWCPPEDCDDRDPSVHPGATEVPYDGVDQDCDPATPDNDLDGDGWNVADDCDDEDASVHPGVDADMDGADACADCDDADPTRSPLLEELAGSGVDEDCDGWVDIDRGADVVTTVRGEEDSEWSMLASGGLAALPDLDGDGGEELVAGTYDRIAVFTGAWLASAPDLAYADAEILLTTGPADAIADADFQGVSGGPDVDADGLPDLVVALGSETATAWAFLPTAAIAAGARTTSEARAWVVVSEHDLNYPSTLATGADLDADGVPDLAVGLASDDTHLERGGAVVVFTGADLGEGAVLEETDAIARLDPEVCCYQLGQALSPLPDLDGDGYASLLASSATLSYLVDGDDLLSGGDIFERATTVIDVASGDAPVRVVVPGDLDADGHPDLLLAHDHEIVLDGTTWQARLDVWLDLWEPGIVTPADAAAHVVDAGGTVAVAEGAFRVGGHDLLLTSGNDFVLLRAEALPLTGTLDLGTVSDRFTPSTSGDLYSSDDWPRYLLALDLDGDGDDDLAGASPYSPSDPDLEPWWYNFAGGMVSVVENPGP